MKIKKICTTIAVALLILLIVLPTAYAITTSYHTVVTTGLTGKSSSQSSTNEAIDYIAVTTYIMVNGVVKNTASDDHYGHAIAGPANAYWTAIGTKTGKGYHTFANQSPWLNVTRWSYDS